MRLNWFATSRFFFFFFFLRVAAQIFTIRPKLNLTNPKPQVAPRFWARKSGSRARNLCPKKLRWTWRLEILNPQGRAHPATSNWRFADKVRKKTKQTIKQTNKLWTVLNLAYPVALHSSPPLSVMVIVVCFRLQVTKSLRVQSHFKTTSTTTTPSLWMEITQKSSLRFIHYRQITIWRKSLSPYFGRPTKSMLMAD